MHHPEKQQFFYHGSTVALGGRITRPFSETIQSQAATAVPSVGGYSTSRVDKFNYRDLIMFDRAESVATGSEQDGMNDTLVMTTIEGLNIMNVVTADRVVARLTSSHGAGGDISILPIGSYFENLRIAGRPIEPRAHDVLMHCGQLSELENRYRNEDTPFVDHEGRSYRFPERRATEAALHEGGGLIRHVDDCIMLTSIFNRPDLAAPFQTTPGGGIYIPGFGEIRLGQYVLTRGSRRISMIVVNLGCAIHGKVVAADPIGNGNPYPP